MTSALRFPAAATILGALVFAIVTSAQPAGPARADSRGSVPPSVQSYTAPETVQQSPLQRFSYEVVVVPRVSLPLAPAPISSPFGMRVCDAGPCTTFHEGMDYAAPEGERVDAVAAGTVSFAGVDGNFGNKVVVEHSMNGEVFTTLYAHLSTVAVTAGAKVARGQLLGAVGNTGRSYGAHLHFEVRSGGSALDPAAWLTAHNPLPYPG